MEWNRVIAALQRLADRAPSRSSYIFGRLETPQPLQQTVITNEPLTDTIESEGERLPSTIIST